MFARDTFLFIALIAYILGSLPTENLLHRLCQRSNFPSLWEFPGERRYFAPFLANASKGILAVLAARLYIGTPMAMILAGLAVLIGHYWSFLAHFRGGTGIGVLFGALLVMAPIVIPFLIAVWLVSYISLENYHKSHILTTVALPLILWQTKRFDLYIIFGTLAALLVGYHLLGEERDHKKRVRQLAFVLLLGSFLTLGFINRYVYRGFGMQVDMIRQGNPELSYVAITFDDGPDPMYTPAILDILAEHNVKATFFMVGRHVEQNPEIARRIVDEGHDIGNHTFSHRSMVPLHPQKVLDEVVRCEDIIKKVTGKRPYLFRPPRGVYSQTVRDIAIDRQYTLVLWSLSSQDWREITSREITDRILNHVCGGDILLFHDSGNLISADGGNRNNTVLALPKILKGLGEKGLVPVTVQEMLIIKGLTHVEDET